ncbi:MAG TPA: DUF1868 domain-containing protein [Thermoflexales bacterium]|nr:DUF1868 domain-containing protein [Thermoflexales bacterium]
MTQYTPEVGRKFYADGLPREFPGNTIICFAQPGSAAYALACGLMDDVRALPFAHKFALLPPSSLHMTTIELLCDQNRRPEKWSAQLPLDAPLEETDQFFLRTAPGVPAPATFHMRYAGVRQRPGLSITLLPASDDDARALREYRDAIARATGVRFPDHDTYRFHISLAYLLMELEPDEELALAALFAEREPILREKFGVFQTGQPQLVFFDDMFRFVPASERGGLRTRGKTAA